MQLEQQQKEKDENFNGVIIMPSDMPYECVKSIIRYVCFDIYHLKKNDYSLYIIMYFAALCTLDNWNTGLRNKMLYTVLPKK